MQNKKKAKDLKLSSAYKNTQKLHQIKILLIEDNPADVVIFKRALEKNNFNDIELYVLSDGQEAVDFVLNNDINLIFLDLNLPTLNGFEVLDKIKSHDDRKTIPVIIFTTSRGNDEKIRSYKKGANAYIRKPAISYELTSIMKDIGGFWFTINEYT